VPSRHERSQTRQRRLVARSRAEPPPRSGALGVAVSIEDRVRDRGAVAGDRARRRRRSSSDAISRNVDAHHVLPPCRRHPPMAVADTSIQPPNGAPVNRRAAARERSPTHTRRRARNWLTPAPEKVLRASEWARLFAGW
jgi:hypothetical protein